MRAKITTGKKVIFAPSVAKDQTKDLTNFLSERFYSVNQSHNSAIVIGSTLAHQAADIEQDTILDSSGVLVTIDEMGIINGARIAVTDGLGGGAGNQQEDEAIHKVAHSTCEVFLDSDKNIDATLSVINPSLSSTTKQVKRKRAETAHASLAAFSYKYNQQKGYSAEFANIGDGLIIVLDKQYKIKQTLLARHVNRGFGLWTPASVQMLTSSDKDQTMIKKTLELAEGDIIVSMTDGIWGELKSNLIAQTEDFRDIELDQKSFEALFDTLADKAYPSTFDLAQMITKQALSVSLEHRKTLIHLVNHLEQHLHQENSIKTIPELLAYFDKTDNAEIAKTLKSILFGQILNDGIRYYEGMDTPVDMVMKDLKSRTVGDCSTINVTRIPYHLDEIIRCFLIYPEKQQALLPSLKASIKTATDLEQSFKRLSLEVIQSEVECKISEAHFKPVFTKEALDKTQMLITHYLCLSSQFDKIVGYEKGLTYIREYFAQDKSLKKDDIKSLLSMLESQIKPTGGFFYQLMVENKSKSYRNFNAQIEACFSEIDNIMSVTGQGSV